ncbi:MAG TPA: LytTR family DNA-binding domain-containing protein [Bryobacteraceae bacterium]|nr:LytTR family DNA-binding domain-containing protein [Bryobacteraceae bacterium]
MNFLRVLVVDDERPARTRLLTLLRKEPDVELTEARDGREAEQFVRSLKPDLMFLDIQMPGQDGFDVLRAIGPARMPVTIFVTAYDRYAIQAFEARALDYLLKPYSDERFESALDRARGLIRSRAANLVSDQLAALLEERRPNSPYIERIVLKTGGRVTFLETREIDWIEAAGPYVYLRTGAKRRLYRATLGQLEQRLDPRRFIRVHRSFMVNADRIHELQPRSHGDYILLLKDGAELTLSRVYRPQLEAWLRQSL